MSSNKPKDEKKPVEKHAEEIQALEEEIASLTVKLSQTERAIEQIELDTLSKLRRWTEESDPPNDKDRDERKKQIYELCEREKKLDKEWEEFRKDRDIRIAKLRMVYLDFIKASHMERDEAKKNPPAKNEPQKATAASSVSLHHSSLLSGTSQSGFDDVDYHRLFKKWEFEPAQLVYETPTAEEKKLGKVLERETSIFRIRMATLIGKEVCVKQFKNYEGEKDKNKAFVAEYRKMKDHLLGHPNLISPIGAIMDKDNYGIIVELARNPEFKSLKDFLIEQTKKTSDNKPITKITFPRKLFIAKSVTLALSWIHGHTKRSPGATFIGHGRLKPSNILFTSDWKVKVGDYGLTLPHTQFVNHPEILFKEHYVHYSAPELLVDPPPKQPTEASDAWALGMIFYTLLTDKIPYQNCTSYDEVKKAIRDKVLPDLPESTPAGFKTIILKLWEHNEKQREVPNKILSDVWPKILKEASLQGVKDGEKIWDAAVTKVPGGDVKTNLIKWEIFGPILWEWLKVTPTADQKDSKGKGDTFKAKENCVKNLLRVTSTDEVKFEHFAEFTKTFSPFRTEPSTLADLVNLCKEKYFYGLKTRSEAEAILNGDAARKIRKDKHNPFILRLSDNMGYQLCFSYIEVNPQSGKEEAIHALISPESYETAGFYQHIKDEIRQKKLVPFDATADRPFDVYFDSKYKEYKLKTHPTGANPSTMFNASISSTGTGKFIQ